MSQRKAGIFTWDPKSKITNHSIFTFAFSTFIPIKIFPVTCIILVVYLCFVDLKKEKKNYERASGWVVHFSIRNWGSTGVGRPYKGQGHSPPLSGAPAEAPPLQRGVTPRCVSANSPLFQHETSLSILFLLSHYAKLSLADNKYTLYQECAWTRRSGNSRTEVSVAGGEVCACLPSHPSITYTWDRDDISKRPVRSVGCIILSVGLIPMLTGISTPVHPAETASAGNPAVLGLAKSGLWAKSNRLPLSVNEVSSERSRVHSYTGLLSPSTAPELQGRPCDLQSIKD